MNIIAGGNSYQDETLQDDTLMSPPDSGLGQYNNTQLTDYDHSLQSDLQHSLEAETNSEIFRADQDHGGIQDSFHPHGIARSSDPRFSGNPTQESEQINSSDLELNHEPSDYQNVLDNSHQLDSYSYPWQQHSPEAETNSEFSSVAYQDHGGIQDFGHHRWTAGHSDPTFSGNPTQESEQINSSDLELNREPSDYQNVLDNSHQLDSYSYPWQQHSPEAETSD